MNIIEHRTVRRRFEPREENFSVSLPSCRKCSWTQDQYSLASSVSRTLRWLLVNRAVPRASSSFLICRLTAPGVGAYQAAKFAVEGFSGVLRQEVADLGIRVTVAEPGAMRTDWAGSSMDIPSFQPEYEATVGAMAKHLRATTGTEPIDPAKVARVFLQLAGNPEPPLHLVLGRSAVDHVARVMQGIVAEDQQWAEVGRSVDFE